MTAIVLSLLGSYVFAANTDSAVTAGDTPTVVGYVEWLVPPSSNYAVVRGNETSGVKLLSQLFDGDKLVVRDPDAQIRLRMSSGDTVVVMASQSPFTVAARGTENTRFSNLVATMQDALTWWFDSPQYEVNLMPRNEAHRLSVPLLANTSPKVIAGNRRFALAWQGGTPPYVLMLRNVDSDEVLAKVEGLTEPAAVLGEQALKKGRYEVTVTDDSETGVAVRHRFRAVSMDSVPLAPANEGLSELPPPVRITAEAYWLAQQDGGAWRLESFMRLSAISDTFPPARLLRRVLGDGEL